MKVREANDSAMRDTESGSVTLRLSLRERDLEASKGECQEGENVRGRGSTPQARPSMNIQKGVGTGKDNKERIFKGREKGDGDGNGHALESGLRILA